MQVSLLAWQNTLPLVLNSDFWSHVKCEVLAIEAMKFNFLQLAVRQVLSSNPVS